MPPPIAVPMMIAIVAPAGPFACPSPATATFVGRLTTDALATLCVEEVSPKTKVLVDVSGEREDGSVRRVSEDVADGGSTVTAEVEVGSRDDALGRGPAADELDMKLPVGAAEVDVTAVEVGKTSDALVTDSLTLIVDARTVEALAEASVDVAEAGMPDEAAVLSVDGDAEEAAADVVETEPTVADRTSGPEAAAGRGTRTRERLRQRWREIGCGSRRGWHTAARGSCHYGADYRSRRVVAKQLTLLGMSSTMSSRRDPLVPPNVRRRHQGDTPQYSDDQHRV